MNFLRTGVKGLILISILQVENIFQKSVKVFWNKNVMLLICKKIQQMIFFLFNKRTTDDFFMLNKWFLYSANDFYIQKVISTCSTNDFYVHQMTVIGLKNNYYIQQMTFTFSKKFIYSVISKFLSVTWDPYSTVWDFF